MSQEFSKKSICFVQRYLERADCLKFENLGALQISCFSSPALPISRPNLCVTLYPLLPHILTDWHFEFCGPFLVRIAWPFSRIAPNRSAFMRPSSTNFSGSLRSATWSAQHFLFWFRFPSFTIMCFAYPTCSPSSSGRQTGRLRSLSLLKQDFADMKMWRVGGDIVWWRSNN